MAKPPNGQQCETCRYWARYEIQTDLERDLGWCVRFPPITEGNPDSDPMQHGHHPCVWSTMWCGEYAPANPETVEDGAATMARLVLLGDLTAARALVDKLRE